MGKGKEDYGVCADCEYFNPAMRARGRCRSLGTATGTCGMPGVLVFCSLYRRKGSPEEKEEVMHFATEVWELPEEWFKE
jgi:hypothetical protein